ncbi:unnamed protein product [Effrenium voratum]|nr:unnamed protein product [Effrenium voratum]
MSPGTRPRLCRRFGREAEGGQERQVAVAIFDDTNIRDGLAFRRMLAQHGHQMWSSDAASFGWVLKAEEPYLEQLLLPLRGRRFQGGIQKLQDFHYTILEGGTGVCGSEPGK